MAFALDGPTLIEVQQGKTATAVFRILATSKPYRNVTLSVSGQPAGMAASFSPLSGKPTFRSTLTVTASSSLLAGDYQLTIRARDAKSSKAMGIVFTNYAGPNIPPPGPGGFDPVRAFPSAQGWGASETIHARSASASVIHVTNLNDSGAGSLRAALTSTGPRYIVFDVSGTINLSSSIDLTSTHSNFYLAGQTSPGGVQVKGAGFGLFLRQGCHDAVIRHLRIRPGGPGASNHFCILVQDNGGANPYNIQIDHCSLQWAGDTLINPYSHCYNVNVQWCNISETLDPGQGAVQIYSTTGKVTFHHNLLVHPHGRVPFSEWGHSTDAHQWINNLVYNAWSHGWAHFGKFDSGGEQNHSTFCNVVNNRWIDGNAGDPTGIFRVIAPTNGGHPSTGLRIDTIAANQGGTKIYETGNVLNASTSIVWADHVATRDFFEDTGDVTHHAADETWFRRGTPFTAPTITTHAATDLKTVIIPSVGACRVLNTSTAVGEFSRDSADQTNCDDAENETGSQRGAGDNGGPWPTLTGSGYPTDTDGDGLPDAYCNAHGIPTTGNRAHDLAPNGYRWIENWLNEVAGDTVQY